MKSNRHTAIAKCKSCQQIIISSGGGVFRYCNCGESFIDQERFSGVYVRVGGPEIPELLEQICPTECDCKEELEGRFSHKDNKQFKTFEELLAYMRDTYKMTWSNKKGDWVKYKLIKTRKL